MSRTARRIRIALLAVVTACVAGVLAAPGATAAANGHVVAYYQTQSNNGSYVSPSPLAGIATDIEVAAFHLNSDGTVHLNDLPPSDSSFNQMWTDLSALQSSGVRVEAMLGGAAQGSYANLHNDFNTYYNLLKTTLQTYHFNGVDLDIEETFSLADTEHLISQLRTDFGSSFVITLAPVATDLSGGSAFSGGFSYKQLESDLGSQISWYNAQFYCGWGSLANTSNYDSVIGNGFAASRVVAGTVTNSANCSGYVDPGTLANTIRSLVGEHSDFAGVAGWEYYDSVGVNGGGPESWFSNVKSAQS